MMIEVFKSVNHKGPEILWDTFQVKTTPYELRQGHSLCSLHAIKAHTINTFDFRGSLAWNDLPGAAKSVDSVSKFKTNLSKYKIYCRCKHCV